jgi:hypothetical protein
VNRSNSQIGIGNVRGSFPMTSRWSARHSGRVRTSLARGISFPANGAGSPKTLATISPRSVTLSHGIERLVPVSFGKIRHVPTAG